MVLVPKHSPTEPSAPRTNPFALLAEYAQRLRAVFAAPPQSADPDTGVYLPSSIRTLLQTGDEAGREEMLSIIHDERWVDSSLYLTLKALDTSPHIQRRLLGDVLTLIRRKVPPADICNRLEAAVTEYSAPISVKCGKLAQISRVGPAGWKGLFHKLNATLLRENVTPCFVAYSALTGLRAIAEDWPNDKPFLIALPKRMRTEGKSSLFVVQFTDADCTLSSWHPNMKHVIPTVHLVDDTRKTGKTFDALREDVHPHPELPDVAPKTYQIVVA